MKYLKINEKLYLKQIEVQITNDEEEKIGATNHIWIYDRSGSMYFTLPELTANLIERAKQIPLGDSITLGWFSSQGDFNFILKGFRIVADTDYKILEEAVKRNSSSKYLTCFSEILNDTNTVIEDLSILGNRFALCFFTDGYPVVNNYTAEYYAIFKAIAQIEGKITASLLIGYGNYYNKTLMAEMAEALGGTLTHSSDLPKFSVTLVDFIENTKGSGAKIKIGLGANFTNAEDLVFSINGKNIIVYKMDEDNQINYIPNTGRGKDYLYVLGSAKDVSQPDNTEVKFTAANVKNGKMESILKGAYAAAYLLMQKTKADQALEVLGTLGDKALIDICSNAFTNDEYGTAERRVNEAATSAKKRFLNGRDTKYLPQEDAFCVLDAIELLMQDDNARFYPKEPGFVYNRIGATKVAKDGYPTFEITEACCPFSNVVWNETKLNLSVLVKIEGKIKLKRNYKALGFKSSKYETWIHRNYALIKDGFLNVKVLPVSMSYATFNTLKTNGLIDEAGKVWSDIAVFKVHLDRIPIMNRTISKGKTSAVDLFKNTYQILRLKAAAKTMKYLRNELAVTGIPTYVPTFANMSDEQVEFLKKHGITNNGFNPPVESVEPTDYYFVKDFAIKIEKVSSLPSIPDVRKKLVAGKALTKREDLIQANLDWYTKNVKEKEPNAKKIFWLDNTLDGIQKKLVTLRSEVQKTKFAIVLGNKWFDEFESRENNSLTIDDTTFKIALTEKRIDI